MNSYHLVPPIEAYHIQRRTHRYLKSISLGKILERNLHNYKGPFSMGEGAEVLIIALAIPTADYSSSDPFSL